MTTGAQLTDWCLKNRVVGFDGVYCSDNLPAVRPGDNFCLIVNHSPCNSASGGSHWLACRIKGSAKSGFTAFWFDSYGKEPDSPLETRFMGSPKDAPPQFVDWMKSMGASEIIWNQRDLQQLTSDVCGEYAAYFCKHGLPRDSKAWSFVSSNLAKNDATIKELVRV